MYLKDTDEDFKYLNSLPGRKILLKGNHDYWWTTVTKMRQFLSENEFKNIDFLYNNAYQYENIIIVGARGWSQTEDEEDKRLLKREALRLQLSIEQGIQQFGENKEIIAFTHYPPINKTNIIKNETNDMLNVLLKYNIHTCYYGHLHGTSIQEAVEGNHFGINFKLVSADGLDFKLLKVMWFYLALKLFKIKKHIILQIWNSHKVLGNFKNLIYYTRRLIISKNEYSKLLKANLLINKNKYDRFK